MPNLSHAEHAASMEKYTRTIPLYGSGQNEQRIHIHVDELYRPVRVRDGRDEDFEGPTQRERGNGAGSEISIADVRRVLDRMMENCDSMRRRLDSYDSRRRRSKYRDELLSQLSLEATRADALRRTDIVGEQDRHMAGLSAWNRRADQFWKDQRNGMLSECDAVMIGSGDDSIMGVGTYGGNGSYPSNYPTGPGGDNEAVTNWRSGLGRRWESGEKSGHFVTDALAGAGYSPSKPCCEETGLRALIAGLNLHNLVRGSI